MKTIAWDVDDVLNDLMQYWFENSWLPLHPECTLRYENISENPPYKLLGISKNGYLDSLDNFRFSKSAQEMKPVAEVIDWFNKRGKNFRHIALTARPLATIPPAASWVFTHFGAWIRTFHFIPAKREGEWLLEYDSDKSDYLHWLGKVDIIVDDDAAIIESTMILGIRGVLMPRPWNKNESTIKEALSLLV